MTWEEFSEQNRIPDEERGFICLDDWGKPLFRELPFGRLETGEAINQSNYHLALAMHEVFDEGFSPT